MKIAILASYGPSLTGLRGDLIAAMSRAGHEVVACAPEDSGELSEAIKSLGARYETLVVQRNGLNPFADLGYLLSVRRLFKREKVQVSLAYSIKPVIYGSIAARLAGVCASSLIPGLGYTFMQSGLSRRTLRAITQLLYRAALGANRTIFFQNPDDCSFFLQQHLVRPEQAQVVDGSGVNLTHFGTLPLPEGPPTFLLVARLIRSKGIFEYIRAAEQLKRLHPSCRFFLAGRYETGPQRISPEELESHTKCGAVEYLGEVKDVRVALRAASVFVLPSWYREGIPRSILEAMASGRPIVTTDSVGCRETVQEGKNGFLVPPQEHEALAAAMGRFLKNRDLISEMGAQSRIFAEERFDVNRVNNVMLGRLGLLPQKSTDFSGSAAPTADA